jgi:hypothetical protein
MSDDPPGVASRDKGESPSDPFEESALLVYTYLKSKRRLVEYRVDSIDRLFTPAGTVGLSDNPPVDRHRSARRTPNAAAASLAHLMRPPAAGVTSALRCVLTCAAYDKVILPYVAQEQHEYIEALTAGDSRQARLIKVRMYLLLVGLVVRALAFPLVRMFHSAS